MIFQADNEQRLELSWKLWHHQFGCCSAGRLGTCWLLVNLFAIVHLAWQPTIIVVVIFQRTVFVLRRKAVASVLRRSLGLILEYI